MKTEEQLYAAIDAGTEGTSDHPDAAFVHQVIGEAEADGDIDVELRACLMAEASAVAYEVRRAEGNEWFRQRLEELTDAQLDHLAMRARASTNAFLRAQYADAVLFRRRGAHDMAEIAVKSHVTHVDRVLAAGHIERGVNSLIRAAQVAARTKNPELQRLAEAAVRAAIPTVVGSGISSAWLVDLTGPILALARQVGDEVARILEAALDGLFRAEVSAPTLNPHRAEGFLEKRTAVRQFLKQPHAARAGTEEQAELYARWADAEQNPLRKAYIYDQAAALFNRAGRPDRAKEMLVRLEANKPALEASLTSVEGMMEVTIESLDRSIAPFLARADAQQVLAAVAASDALMPRIPPPGQPTRQRSVIEELVSTVRLDPGMNMAPVTEGRREAVNAARDYQEDYAGEYATRKRLLQRLVADKGLTADEVLNFLVGWEMMPAARVPFIESALGAYFRNDTIGFIRGISAEFEALLRHLAAVADLPVMKQGPSGDQLYRSGKELVSVEPIRSAIGPHVAYNVDMILYERHGMNLRDLDAHAIATAEVYSDALADALLLLLLRLTRATRTALEPQAGSAPGGAADPPTPSEAG